MTKNKSGLIQTNNIAQTMIRLGGMRVSGEVKDALARMVEALSVKGHAGLPSVFTLKDYEENLRRAIKENIGSEYMLTTQGVLRIEAEGKLERTDFIPFFSTAAIKPGSTLEQGVGVVAEQLFTTAQEACGASHVLSRAMGMMLGSEITFPEIWGIVNVYELGGKVRKMASTGVRLTLTKGDCILCSDPIKDVTKVTFPAQVLATHLPGCNEDGDPLMLYPETREATFTAALRELEGEAYLKN